jgi:serine/threonine protein kinase
VILSAGAKDTDHWEVPKSIRRFTIQELAKATGGFDKLYHIGSGGFGQVYSGCLEDGTLIAIKRASPSSLQGHTEFRKELSLLSRLHHRHLVRLEGFCDDNGQQAFHFYQLQMPLKFSCYFVHAYARW